MEINEIKRILKEKKYKRVLIQVPDGLKPKIKEFYEELKKEFKDIEFYIWVGSNYGGCDIPIWLDKYVDLIIHIGHNKFYKLRLK